MKMKMKIKTKTKNGVVEAVVVEDLSEVKTEWEGGREGGSETRMVSAIN